VTFSDPVRLPASGALDSLSPLVRRLVAPNASPMTSTGTCTYLVGKGDVVVIDPGPDDPRHLRNLLAATEGERIRTLLVTHSHSDHVGLVAKLKRASGAEVLGAAAAGRADSGLDAGADRGYAPDQELKDGETYAAAGIAMTAIATPGHAANHLCFAFPQENSLFSGDHVMAWSTTIVAPPEGNMNDYMASLEKLRGRSDAIFWPGHGGGVVDPQRYVGAIVKHRLQREAAILARIQAGDGTIVAIADKVYRDLVPALKGAAQLSTLAHVERLIALGLARGEGDLRTGGAVSATPRDRRNDGDV
jgi:glyoxylase-like metal-dependent hydrolase (beta-lactamase superfamily II)